MTNENDFVRDTSSGALVNANKHAFNQRKMILKNKARIDDLERRLNILTEEVLNGKVGSQR